MLVAVRDAVAAMKKQGKSARRGRRGQADEEVRREVRRVRDHAGPLRHARLPGRVKVEPASAPTGGHGGVGALPQPSPAGVPGRGRTGVSAPKVPTDRARPHEEGVPPMSTKAYAAQSADSPARPVVDQPPRPAADGRRDRDPLLRRLPLRPAPGAQRVAQHRLPLRARPRDRRARGHRAGSKVTKFKEGDLAAVGCMVDSCRTCDNCKRGPRAVLHERRDGLHLQRPGQARRRHADLTAATPSASSSTRRSR